MRVGFGFGFNDAATALPAVISLTPLSLDDLTIAEDQTTGTKVGTIIGAKTGSTVTLQAQSDADMFAKDGNDIEVGAAGLDYETTPSPTITLRETLAEAVNSPLDTVIPITVTNVLEVTLSALSLDDLTIDEGSAQGTKVGTITGGSSGSTITLHAQSDANWFQKDGGDIEVGSGTIAAGSPTITLRETHPDASNTPRDTVITITVEEAGAYVFTNAEAEALVARMSSQPNNTRKGLIDDLVGALKTAGVWAKMDALYVLAAHTSQAALLNWVSTSFNCTVNGSPTFTADRGYTGNATDAWLDTGFNPTTAPTPKFTQDSAHASAWCRTTGTVIAIFGQVSSNNCELSPSSGGTTFIAKMNNSLPATGANPDTNVVGHFVAVRPDGSTNEGYKNGSSIAISDRSSAAPNNSNFTILRSSSQYTSGEVAAAHFGQALSSTEAADFYTALQTYMTAVGA